MPEQSKFRGALAKLKERPAEQGRQPPPIIPASAEQPRPIGRPPGKRSDPDFEKTTVLLRKQTKKRANRKLEDEDAGQDLSDLIEQLLSKWIGQGRNLYSRTFMRMKVHPYTTFPRTREHEGKKIMYQWTAEAGTGKARRGACKARTLSLAKTKRCYRVAATILAGNLAGRLGKSANMGLS